MLLGFATPALAVQERLEDKRLPDGRLQSEAILEEDHKRNLADLETMRELLDGIEDSLKKNSRHVLSMENLRKLEEIEKVSRRVRDRMKRY